MKLLEIQSSPRGESSDSITQSFIEACKSDNDSIVVDTLNVWHERLPEFDYEAIGAKYKAVKHQAMTEAESSVWERIQSLIKRFQNADRIVLGTPMWNFGLPYKLKQLIDLVARLTRSPGKPLQRCPAPTSSTNRTLYRRGRRQRGRRSRRCPRVRRC